MCPAFSSAKHSESTYQPASELNMKHMPGVPCARPRGARWLRIPTCHSHHAMPLHCRLKTLRQRDCAKKHGSHLFPCRRPTTFARACSATDSTEAMRGRLLLLKQGFFFFAESGLQICSDHLTVMLQQILVGTAHAPQLRAHCDHIHGCRARPALRPAHVKDNAGRAGSAHVCGSMLADIGGRMDGWIPVNRKRG